MNSKLLSPFWLVSSSTVLSCAWLLPNHAPPWLTFHDDAWTASLLSLVGIWIIWKEKSAEGWHTLTLTAGFLFLVPWAQYVAGLIPSFGTAWINSAYLLGFLFALIIGEKWENASPRQCADFVFLAVITAGVVSVNLQLRQWADLDTIGFWTMRLLTNGRYYANLGQPNQLGTLLLLGVVACSWAYYRKVVGPVTTVFLAIFLLTGTALTESRTALLNLIILLLGLTIWRKKLPSNAYYFSILFLASYFILCSLVLPLIGQNGDAFKLRAPASSERLDAWKLFLDASLEQPFFGFGWGPLAKAYYSVVPNYPGSQNMFLHSHNIIIDLILWNGYPLAIIVTTILIWWLVKAIRYTTAFEDFHYLAFIIILGVHSLLEYPLQYAFFLFPMGLIIGAMHTKFQFQTLFRNPRWLQYTITITSIGFLAITVRDYFNVETSFYGLRFEYYKIKTDIPAIPPNVFALTQLRDNIILARNKPSENIDVKSIQWMIDTVYAMPSSLNIYKLATNLVMNDRISDAQKWIERLCKTNSQASCHEMQTVWENAAISNPKMSNIRWPNPATEVK